MDHEATFWNGERCEARRVIVTVPPWVEGVHPALAWWRHMAATVLPAVAVTYNGDTFVLADDDGSGWRKVTEGHGSPNYPHRQLPAEALQQQLVLVPAGALRHIVDLLELLELDEWSDEDDHAYKTLAEADHRGRL